MLRTISPLPAPLFFIVGLLAMFILPACIWGPVSLEEELIYPEEPVEKLFVGSLVMIYNDDVYLLDSYGQPPKRLTNSPQEPKRKIALAHGKDKIAYLDQNAFPVLIDTSGQELAYLTEYGPILYLGWSGDDQTLWMMGEDRTSFQYFGPDMGLPDNSNAFPAALQALDVSSTGVVAFLTGTSLRIHSHPSGDSLVFSIEEKMEHITFSQDGTNILYSRSSQQVQMTGTSFRIVDISNRKINNYQLESRGNFLTPILNTDGQEMMYASTQAAYSPLSLFYTNIRHLSFLPTSESGRNTVPDGAYLSFLGTNTRTAYLDWKP